MNFLIGFISAILSTAGSGPATTGVVTVIGGPNAGNYSVASQAPCEIDKEDPPKPKHSFSIMLGAPGSDGQTIKDPKVMTVLSLMVPDADRESGNTQFFAEMNFGDPPLHGKHYKVDPHPEKGAPVGSGAVGIVVHGGQATVNFDVKTADAVEFKGVIQCSRLLRL